MRLTSLERWEKKEKSDDILFKRESAADGRHVEKGVLTLWAAISFYEVVV